MILAWLLLLTGLTISAVAIYYSVVGLTAIFAAAALPIIVMGTTLEVAKLVCASWLKANWERVPVLMKTYMTIAVAVLMLITSMGIFGFLSKAHMDQTLVSGDVQSKLAIYDQKIQTARENIEADRRQLKQMDEAVDQVMARSKDERGATNANNIRKSQQRDRAALAKSIEANQKLIATLNDEAAPIRAEIRKVEAEVGPIKYIAAFVYGDNPDANLLEKAVTWVIMIIVLVFDPLAVIMLLAAQMTFQWARERNEQESYPTIADLDRDVGEKPTKEELAEEVRVSPTKFVDHGEHPKDNYGYEDTETEKVPATEPVTATGGDITAPEEQQKQEDPVEQWNKMLAQAERAVATETVTEPVQDTEPLERPGDYLPESEDGSKKKELHDEGRTGAHPVKEPGVGYVQNEEQTNPTSIWSKINQRANIKPVDELYRLYNKNKFEDIVVDKNTDPEFYAFIEESKERPRFNNHSKEQLEYFVRRIYEFRENNSDNSAR